MTNKLHCGFDVGRRWQRAVSTQTSEQCCLCASSKQLTRFVVWLLWRLVTLGPLIGW